MFKSGETSHKAIGVLLLVVLVIGLALILESRPLIPQAPAGGITYPPPATEQIRAPVSPTQEADSQTPYPPPGDGSSQGATIEAVTAPQVEPPPCIFEGGPEPEAIADSLDDFIFAEPKILPSLSTNVRVAQWLPDNRRFLFVRDLPEMRQQIEIFDVESRLSQIVAERRTLYYNAPVWLQALNAAVYSEEQKLKISNMDVITNQLWMSKGTPKSAQILTDDLQDLSLAVNSDGDQVAYLADNQSPLHNPELMTIQAADSNPLHFDTANLILPTNEPLQMAWRPGTSQIVFYNYGDRGGYLFLVDIDTNKTCRINIGGWAGLARWSANGRYLAAIRSWGRLPSRRSELVVLDGMTGVLYTISVLPKDAKGEHQVEDIAWASDNRHLVVIGESFDHSIPDANGKYSRKPKLYLVDFINNQRKQILPNRECYSVWWGTSLSWSPDGSKLLAACKIEDLIQFTLILVGKKK